jgi:transcriptional regulator with XRE-family HTH domain
MNQVAIGNYIVQKRRALNLTQEQLADMLGVSNKTVSKWENGKSMPDYSIIQKLCETIHVTIAELMDGKDAAEDGVRAHDEEQILDLLRRTQELERQRRILCGVMLIILGIASNALSATIEGSNVRDFISGFLLGLSIVEMLAGLIIAVKSYYAK